VLQDGLQIYSYTYYYDMSINFFWITTMKYLIIFILTAGCVKSEHDFITAPPGLTSAIYEQLIKIEGKYENK